MEVLEGEEDFDHSLPGEGDLQGVGLGTDLLDEVVGAHQLGVAGDLLALGEGLQKPGG